MVTCTLVHAASTRLTMALITLASNDNRSKSSISTTDTTTAIPAKAVLEYVHGYISESRSGYLLQMLRRIYHIFDVVWGFTESDFGTFVIPDMAFGLLGALASATLVDGDRSSSFETLLRIPALLIYNWSNLVVFDLANQRGADSVAEDKINKPWRPIPMGKITIEQTRRAMIVAVPLSLALNWYQGVWTEGLLIHVTTWMYNDLGGGDEFLVRDALAATGYAMFNSGSLKIAGCREPTGPPGCGLNARGLAWTAIISGIIFTTMQIQDLKDVEGDRGRGRKTVVLHVGERFSRWSIALCVLAWSCICVYFWGAEVASSTVVASLAAIIAWRVVGVRNQPADRITWQLWCLWLISLYLLPVVGVLDLSHKVDFGTA